MSAGKKRHHSAYGKRENRLEGGPSLASSSAVSPAPSFISNRPSTTGVSVSKLVSAKDEFSSPRNSGIAPLGVTVKPMANTKEQEGYDLLRAKIDNLEADIARRQESYIRRERAYKTR